MFLSCLSTNFAEYKVKKYIFFTDSNIYICIYENLNFYADTGINKIISIASFTFLSTFSATLGGVSNSRKFCLPKKTKKTKTNTISNASCMISAVQVYTHLLLQIKCA